MTRLIGLLAAVSTFALSAGVHAQRTSPPVETADSNEADIEPNDAIVVTGSRIVRDGFSSPTPVTVLSTNILNLTNPTSISDGLRDLPQLSGMGGVANGLSASSANAQSIAVGTGSYPNLRRLGAARTLVLQDGIRIPPNRAEGLVDTNLLPQLLVDRVEIVTGGASAVYGSDAVAGVVNFIVNNRFKGLKGTIQAGITDRSDARNYRLGLAGGVSLLDDRLHVVASAERYENDGIQSMCDRALGCNLGVWGGVNGATNFGTPANPLTFYTGAGRSTLSFGGRVVQGPAGIAGMNFNSAGAFVPNQPGTAIGNGFCINCDGGNSDPSRTTLVPRIATNQAYGHIEYDVSDNVAVWGQATYGLTRTRQFSVAQANQGNLVIFNGNAYLPAAAQAALAAAGPNSSFTLGKQWLSLPHFYTQLTAKTLDFAGGVRGEISGRFKWDLTATRGTSRNIIFGREMNLQKAYAALDAVRSPSGAIVCRVSLTNPGVMPGCAPLNPFGDFNASPESLAYIQDSYQYRQRIRQKALAANIGGPLFALWAGEVSVSLGGEYRKVMLDVTGNQTPIDSTGVRRGSGGALRYVANNVFPTQGRVSVKEVYGEAAIPLVRNSPLAQSIELNIAGRYTNYSTSGSVETWKAGVVWDVVDELRFRGTRSRDIRAPSLFDLFAPTTIGPIGFFDALTNTNQAVTQITGGNRNLKPEKADTTVIGTVLKPSFMPGFTMSVDWYRIKVKGAIAQPFTAQELGNRCFASGGADPVCDTITRPFPITNTSSANAPTSIFVGVINVSSETRQGVDLEMAYRTAVGSGSLSAQLNVNYQGTNTSIISPGTAPVKFAGRDFTKLLGNALVSYDISDWSFSLRERFIGGRRQDRRASYVNPHIDPVYYTDITISKRFEIAGNRISAFLNVTNLFDKLPPLSFPPDAPFITPGQRYPADLGVYDIFGRRLVLGARFEI